MGVRLSGAWRTEMVRRCGGMPRKRALRGAGIHSGGVKELAF